MIQVLNIPEDWVASGNTTMIESLFSSDISGSKARSAQGTIAITFKELEREEIRIFDMPGVSEYWRLLHSRIPHLFYFLAPYRTIGAMEAFFIAFSSKLQSIAEPKSYEIPMELSILTASHLTHASQFAIKKGDDWRYMLDAYSNELDELKHIYELVETYMNT